MTGWLAFEGRVEAIAWGRATCTIPRLPPDAGPAFAAQGAKRAGETIGEHPVSLALEVAG